MILSEYEHMSVLILLPPPPQKKKKTTNQSEEKKFIISVICERAWIVVRFASHFHRIFVFYVDVFNCHSSKSAKFFWHRVHVSFTLVWFIFKCLRFMPYKGNLNLPKKEKTKSNKKKNKRLTSIQIDWLIVVNNFIPCAAMCCHL